MWADIMVKYRKGKNMLQDQTSDFCERRTGPEGRGWACASWCCPRPGGSCAPCPPGRSWSTGPGGLATFRGARHTPLYCPTPSRWNRKHVSATQPLNYLNGRHQWFPSLNYKNSRTFYLCLREIKIKVMILKWLNHFKQREDFLHCNRLYCLYSSYSYWQYDKDME